MMDELGKSIPVSEGMIDAEQGGERKQPNEFCLNCGTKLLDTFCHHCGQKDIPQRQTLGELWTNFISSFWSYEGKFFRTTRYLITKPGFLAQEYCAGKRESYYHPARMYVFISFVFFFAFFAITDSDETDKSEKETVELTEKEEKEIAEKTKKGFDQVVKFTGDSSFVALGDSIQKQVKASSDTTKSKKKKKGAANFNFDDVAEYKTVEAYDSIQLTKPQSDRDNWFVRLVSKRVINVRNKYGEDSEKLGEEFLSGFKDNFSKVLFYLLPFFALLLKLLYVRRGYYYSEHLVFSIYYYNFFYLAGTLQILVGLLPWLAWTSTFIGFWIVLYLVFAMKRMYKQSWRKTILKYLVFSFLFIILVVIAFAITAFVVFLSI